nr:alpha/beta family hydrolase [Candidatus Acidoferrales bacterium]
MPESIHRSVFIEGPAGRLEGLFWDASHVHLAQAEPPIAAVVCHPHPLFGGSMHNKVVYQVARTLDRLGVPSLRFNFRGVGLSAGTHDRGHGEQDDVRAALNYMAREFPEIPVLIAGFSFGCWVGLRVGSEHSRVTELVGVGPPVGNSNFSYLAKTDKPRIFILGEKDQYGSPEQLEELIETFPEATQRVTQTVIVPGANHFFVGQLNEVDAALTSWLVERHPALVAKK